MSTFALPKEFLKRVRHQLTEIKELIDVINGESTGNRVNNLYQKHLRVLVLLLL